MPVFVAPSSSLRSWSSPRGVSLTEVLCAAAILVTAMAGLAPLFLTAAKATMDARTQTMATVLAAQRVEQLRGLNWGFDQNAPAVRISDFTTDLSGRGATNGGRGLSQSPADALWVNTPGYVDYLDPFGQWVGSGSSPPPGTSWVRRWSIEPQSPSPDDLLLLQVLVIPIAVSRAAHQEARRDSIWLRDGARLVTVRARMAR